MDSGDRQKIESINRDRAASHRKLLATGSKTYRAFLEMEKAAFGDGKLARKYKELIAVGISLVTDCESCMDWHIHQALEAGATEEQILEAIDVGIEMGGGPATVSSRFALKVLDYHMGKP
jgi:AhpD family alkylhydroperoxidase